MNEAGFRWMMPFMINSDSSPDRKVLIAFDGSEHSYDALTLGKQLCQLLDADPLVVHCMRFPRYLIDPTELEVAIGLDESPKLEDAAEFLTPLHATTRTVTDESPARALSAEAEKEEVLAVVVGSSHRGDYGRVLLGSTGKKMISGSPCPIAIAPRGYRERAKTIRRLCVAIDEGDESQHALDEAIALARRAHASLNVVSVMDENTIGMFSLGALEELEAIQRRYVADLLERASSRIPPEIHSSVKRLEGNPVFALAGHSEAFDLMLVGSRSYGPVRRVLLGSVSAGLTRMSRCPLVILPRSAGSGEIRFNEIQASAAIA